MKVSRCHRAVLSCKPHNEPMRAQSLVRRHALPAASTAHTVSIAHRLYATPSTCDHAPAVYQPHPSPWVSLQQLFKEVLSLR